MSLTLFLLDTNLLPIGGFAPQNIQYIAEELACYTAGMPKDMQRHFNFVHIVGNTSHDIKDDFIMAGEF
jgi:hypothetical protein